MRVWKKPCSILMKRKIWIRKYFFRKGKIRTLRIISTFVQIIRILSSPRIFQIYSISLILRILMVKRKILNTVTFSLRPLPKLNLSQPLPPLAPLSSTLLKKTNAVAGKSVLNIVQATDPRQPKTDCSICFDPTDQELKCKHYICSDCILRLRKPKCPLCRGPLEASFITEEILNKLAFRE